MFEPANSLSKKSKRFFFEKKKQKTSVFLGVLAPSLPKSPVIAIEAKKTLGCLALALTLTACGTPTPGPFYATPANPAAPHGTLIAATPFFPTIPDAAAYRVIYNSESESGAIIPVSGLVYIPTADPPPGGRNIVAWAHPTTGVAQSCAPSLDSQAATTIPGLPDFIAAGDIVTATDYEGLGEPGTHPYLIGKAEGQNIIDSVLAAKTIPGANPSGNYVVWGHSQGAQAVLFAGQIAKSYAPKLNLVGVAAAAPVTNLNGELTEPFNGNTGRLLAAYVYSTWSQTYHVPITTVVDPRAIPAVQNTAAKCIDNLPDAAGAVIAASALNPVFLSSPPQTTPPWPALFDQNSPGHSPPGAPLLILQGSKDPTVEPHWTRTFVTLICSHHNPIAYHELPGIKHLNIATKSLPILTPWIAARFAGTPAPDTCGAE
jgi:alpha-beta hydrolase superfamily lysophospholipase